MTSLVRASVQAMEGYVPGEQPTVPGIVKLNTNENPYPPSPLVVQALQSLDEDAVRRYPDPHSRALREKIAELHGCEAERVFVGNGSDEILALCTRSFVENDGSVGYFNPSYSLYPVLADIRGVERRPVELAPDFGWIMPDDRAGSLFFLANPNAPTGIRFDRGIVRDFCRSFRGVVLIDEAYVDFAQADCMDLAKEKDNVLVSRSLSKSFSLAGVRLGYAVGALPLTEALFKTKDSYNVSVLAQRVGLAAMTDLEAMREHAGKIRSTRARLAAELTSLGWDAGSSEANFLWVRPPAGNGAEVFGALRARNILVRHFEGARTGEYLRISIGTDKEIDALVGAVREIMKEETGT